MSHWVLRNFENIFHHFFYKQLILKILGRLKIVKIIISRHSIVY